MAQSDSEIRFIEGKEKEDFLEMLNNQFGVKSIPGIILMRGKERIFLFSGSFGKGKIKSLERMAFVERAGVYLGKIDDFGVRLSIEGSQILKSEIKKNIVDLDKAEMETWMMGHELLKKTGLAGFVIMRYKRDMLGTGKASEDKITNFIPKSRRLKDKNVES
jgi:NOL1/NOP2/fmu family ribosome biogenesis protein